jgi:hypothetical protein
MRERTRAVLLLLACLGGASGCGDTADRSLSDGHRRALTDTLATLFDSLSAIHRDHPDTGVLRRLHPPADTLMSVEGSSIERLTGDSLFRRVLSLHVPVSAMAQRFPSRSGLLLDADHAILTATEQVDWVDTAGAHRYTGLLTIAVSRIGPRWVIRAYRGT